MSVTVFAYYGYRIFRPVEGTLGEALKLYISVLVFQHVAYIEAKSNKLPLR